MQNWQDYLSVLALLSGDEISSTIAWTVKCATGWHLVVRRNRGPGQRKRKAGSGGRRPLACFSRFSHCWGHRIYGPYFIGWHGVPTWVKVWGVEGVKGAA